MTSYFFIPALKKSSGGMYVITQIANQLHEAGYVVKLVSNGILPPDLENPWPLPVLQINEVRLAHEDRWIVPEGWPLMLWSGLRAGAKCVAYVQNWAFLHGLLPKGVKWSDLHVRLLAVSNPVSQFISQTTGVSAPVIGPVIDRGIFYPPERKPVKKSIRIAWMPRKNKHLADQIRTIFESLIARTGGQLPDWIAIDDMSREDVAKVMRASDIFLSTGFPEGFGLPPLEAMACGCVAAGFTGMGGWEYMRNALPNGFTPPFSLPDVPWGPNGFYAADGDVWGAALALESAYDACLSAGALPLVESGQKAAMWFNEERQTKEILDIWENKEFWDACQ